MAARINLDVSRIEAVDGLQLSDAEFDKAHPRTSARRMTKGEVACFMSHRLAWQQIAQSQHSFGAVLEDDIYFSSSLSSLLSTDRWLRNDVDLVKLDKGTDKKVCLGNDAIYFAGVEIRRLYSIHLRAGAYILSKRFAKELLLKTEKFHVPVDDYLFSPGYGILETNSIWQASPCVCTHPQHSKLEFLPKEASVSFLEEERTRNRREHSRKRSILSRVLREIKRPIRDLNNFIERTFFKSTDKTWTYLNFME